MINRRFHVIMSRLRDDRLVSVFTVYAEEVNRVRTCYLCELIRISCIHLYLKVFFHTLCAHVYTNNAKMFMVWEGFCNLYIANCSCCKC